MSIATMSLNELPPELKLAIAEILDPQSCLHLTLTCRDLYNLCQTMLEEHERLFSELRIIRSDQTNRHVLWTTLRAVLKDPRKGWYVRELDLPASRGYHWDRDNLGQHGNQPPNPLGDLPEKDQELFQQAARALERLYCVADEDFPDDGVDIMELIRTIELRIGAGYDDGIIAVLIHHLPFLQTIRITDLETIALEDMLVKIAAAYKNQSKVKGLPLQRLTSASVAHWDSEYSCSSSWAADLLSLPSMHFFAANAMSGHHDFYGNPDTAFAGIMPYSNLTELYLISCAFDVENLEAILAGIRGLRKFTYTDGGATVSDSEFEPKKIIAAVEKRAGHSLEELRLDRDMADASVCHPILLEFRGC
ncbi:hypothetical protein N0V83_001782 [Neocucurbitaria cava]|uniref:F-box domain-containing protein n=1 Tax=Neocucurbitaria cava TaxID=798079 RepID=A0A9W8YFX2_9PLEO|nr:hypothetical protein N0V83_001782 [Neocucurbitaria cava]